PRGRLHALPQLAGLRRELRDLGAPRLQFLPRPDPAAQRVVVRVADQADQQHGKPPSRQRRGGGPARAGRSHAPEFVRTAAAPPKQPSPEHVGLTLGATKARLSFHSCPAKRRRRNPSESIAFARAYYATS